MRGGQRCGARSCPGGMKDPIRAGSALEALPSVHRGSGEDDAAGRGAGQPRDPPAGNRWEREESALTYLLPAPPFPDTPHLAPPRHTPAGPAPPQQSLSQSAAAIPNSTLTPHSAPQGPRLPNPPLVTLYHPTAPSPRALHPPSLQGRGVQWAEGWRCPASPRAVPPRTPQTRSPRAPRVGTHLRDRCGWVRGRCPRAAPASAAAASARSSPRAASCRSPAPRQPRSRARGRPAAPPTRRGLHGGPRAGLRGQRRAGACLQSPVGP